MSYDDKTCYEGSCYRGHRRFYSRGSTRNSYYGPRLFGVHYPWNPYEVTLTIDEEEAEYARVVAKLIGPHAFYRIEEYYRCRWCGQTFFILQQYRVHILPCVETVTSKVVEMLTA